MTSEGMPITPGPSGTRSERGRLGAAFLVALALHAGAVAAVALWPRKDDRSPPGEQEITIDLAPAMEAAEALTQAEASAPAEVLAEAREVEPPVTETPPPEEMVEEVMEAKPREPEEAPDPEPAPVHAAPVEAPSAPEPEVVAAPPPPEEVVPQAPQENPVPKPAKPPRKKPEPKPRPAPRKAVAEQRAAPSVPRQGQASSSRENMGGAAAAADPNAFNRYAAQLAAALRGRLRYPDAARAQGLAGVATIRFTMQRSGQILSASLVRSAGHNTLDQAALATAAPGASLPPAPDAVPQQQLTFVVPLRFNLR